MYKLEITHRRTLHSVGSNRVPVGGVVGVEFGGGARPLQRWCSAELCDGALAFPVLVVRRNHRARLSLAGSA
jgi:hypothetical protein